MTSDEIQSMLKRLPLIRKARTVAWRTRVILLHGRPHCVVSYGGGIGDDLLCTSLFHEMRQRGKTGLWIMSDYPSLFEHNKDIDHVVPTSDFRYATLVQKLGGKFLQPRTSEWDPERDMDVHIADKHVISRMCEQAGIKGEVSLRPYFPMLESEQVFGRTFSHQIAIQASGLAAKFHMTNKEWYPKRFQQVVDTLKKSFQFIQLGSLQDPALTGVLDMRGKTSLRETAAILSQSLVFVGLEGLLMHLARSVECRSVIVFGGRSLPELLGYNCNENLVRRVPCSPCWMRNTCTHEHRCMNDIGHNDVTQAILRQVEQYSQPLSLAIDFLA